MYEGRELLAQRDQLIAKEVRQAIDTWSAAQGLAIHRPEHQELAKFIVLRIQHRLRVPRAKGVSLLLTCDGSGGYAEARLLHDYGPAEELLYPEDPTTGEPVDEAIADVVVSLPHPDCVPEL